MIFRGKPRFELLDQYLARREYTLALEAITEEIKRRPENFNLLLRQAEILGQAGDREQAITVYRNLARHYTDQGFFARAIAVTNKILRLDPDRQEVTAELAELIAAQKQSEQADRQRLERSVSAPAPEGEARKEPTAAEPGDSRPQAPAPAPAPPQREEPQAPPEEDQAPPSEETEFELIFDTVDEEPEPEETPHATEASEAMETPRPDAPPQPDQEDSGPAPTPAEEQEEQARREREASQFFAAFPRPALDELLSSTAVRSFEAHEVIVREGEPGASLFLIETGTVQVVTHDPKGAEVALAVLGPGDFFGEVALLAGVPRTATIVAREHVNVIEISRDHLFDIAARYPEIREMLDRFYRKRAQATVEAMLARLRGGDG